jgi:hypothetical protein
MHHPDISHQYSIASAVDVVCKVNRYSHIAAAKLIQKVMLHDTITTVAKHTLITTSAIVAGSSALLPPPLVSTIGNACH